MRATRSDSLILDECWLPDSAAVFQSDDMQPFRHTYLNWFWGSYTPVYLGVAQAAFDRRDSETGSGARDPCGAPRNAGVQGGTESSNLLCSSGESGANSIS
jgi:hypothetical protein